MVNQSHHLDHVEVVETHWESQPTQQPVGGGGGGGGRNDIVDK